MLLIVCEFYDYQLDRLYVSHENKWNNMHMCVCVYHEDKFVHTATEYSIWSLSVSFMCFKRRGIQYLLKCKMSLFLKFGA
jgi:hypothetical protein